MKLFVLTIMLCVSVMCIARNITVKAVNQPASVVFRSIVEQTGKNFVYSSELLKDMRVTVNVTDKPLRHALNIMFLNTDIEYRVKGNNIILKRKRAPKGDLKRPKHRISVPTIPATSAEKPTMLNEIVVMSRLESPAVETTEIGAGKMNASEISATPVLFGESDVIKTLHLQPGIGAGAEGMAEMHVHGGDNDENLVMLDNVPLYQANHFAGLFSAFNTDAIRYIDFFKSSVPAKYDGRLSSYLDVRTKNGAHDRHQGSLRLGITSGSFFLGGPIGSKTNYIIALRRSWFDLLTTVFEGIYNSTSQEEKIRLGYAFTDFNGKITHRLNSRASLFASIYFGNDYLRTGTKDTSNGENYWSDDEKFNFNWGNIVAQTGLYYLFSPTLAGEFTAAYTRFFNSYRHTYRMKEQIREEIYESSSAVKTDNHIDDWIARGDIDWRPNDVNHMRFGGAISMHSFQPARTSRSYITPSETIATRDSVWSYSATEANIYVENEMHFSERLRLNAGFHWSLFHIDRKTRHGLGPRLSVNYLATDNWALKFAYARTNQYVHQLCQTYLALPTDQWVPVSGKFKPQTADKISIGAYWQPDNCDYSISVEGFYKEMHHLVDYLDEYYLKSPLEMWDARLCSGKGTAKGIDVKIEKTAGHLTGHVAYSLGWSDRTFAEKNGGHTFPARFDHRHTVNILVNWHINDKVQLNAAWTGHSGSRFTLMPQVWESPDFSGIRPINNIPLKAGINNYQLPFYHRLDLSCMVRNKHGFWNFSLYNAYCHLNTVAIRRTYTYNGIPVFQKVKMFPVIPSISYTWQF